MNMSRFLTARDVESASTDTILVSEATLVSPHALELAAERGVSVVTPSGPWTAKSHASAPDDSGALGTSLVVVAVGENRVGVLARIAKVLAEHDATVDDVEQKVESGYFHLVIYATMVESSDYAKISTSLVCIGAEEGLAVRLFRAEVFDFMHRI